MYCTRVLISLDALLNRADKSRVISYKDNGQGHVRYHDLEVYLVCFDKSC
jgi:hypothetical protein